MEPLGRGQEGGCQASAHPGSTAPSWEKEYGCGHTRRTPHPRLTVGSEAESHPADAKHLGGGAAPQETPSDGLPSGRPHSLTPQPPLLLRPLLRRGGRVPTPEAWTQLGPSASVPGLAHSCLHDPAQGHSAQSPGMAPRLSVAWARHRWPCSPAHRVRWLERVGGVQPKERGCTAGPACTQPRVLGWAAAEGTHRTPKAHASSSVHCLHPKATRLAQTPDPRHGHPWGPPQGRLGRHGPALQGVASSFRVLQTNESSRHR